MRRRRTELWVYGHGRLTNRKIQAQRLIEPQMPLSASRVVKGWLAAAATASVNMVSMLCVFTRSVSYDENCGEQFEILCCAARGLEN